MKLLSPKPLLHMEGLAVLVGASFAYRYFGDSWRLFALLFLAPDLLMAGYVFGPKFGASIYNCGHTYLPPLLLSAIAYYDKAPALYAISLIWAAHIGFDRFLGYGLKYDTAFKDTHLGKV